MTINGTQLSFIIPGIKRKYERTPGETCHERWARQRIEAWQVEMDNCDDIIGDYDMMTVDELISRLEAGDQRLAWAHRRKAKLTANIEKHSDPVYIAERANRTTKVVKQA